MPERHKQALMADANLIFASPRRVKRSGMEIKMDMNRANEARDMTKHLGQVAERWCRLKTIWQREFGIAMSC